MSEFKLIAMDTSKYVFTLHGVNERGEVVLRLELRRGQVETFFRKLPPTDVVLEACGGSHHWGRLLGGLGHRVRLVPPQYAKPFVKRGKNDHIDAEAICEAALRPGMTFVPVKSTETQANAMVLSVRESLVKQQTQAINAGDMPASSVLSPPKARATSKHCSHALPRILRSRKQPRTCSQNSVRMSPNCQRAWRSWTVN